MIDKDTILSNWDLSTVPSPCYVLHETLLADNLRVIDKVRKATGAEIIVALKANAMWSIFLNSADIRMEPLPVRWRRLVLFLKNMALRLILMLRCILKERSARY